MELWYHLSGAYMYSVKILYGVLKHLMFYMLPHLGLLSAHSFGNEYGEGALYHVRIDGYSLHLAPCRT